MPVQNNMIKGKKGVSLPVEFLVRVLIMIFLVIVVFNIGKTVGKSLFSGFFGNDLEKNFDEFANELNKPFTVDVPSRQAFITLDTNTAIIGFSTSKSFECLSCGSGSLGTTSVFEKPNIEECNGKSCVCLCPKALQMTGSNPYKMKCDKIKCKSLNKGLAESIELKNYIEKAEREQQRDYSFLKNAKWNGGFLFERHSRGTFTSNGLPQPLGRRFTVYINKAGTEDKFYLAVCPGPECKYSFEKPKEETIPEICNIVNECFDSLKIRKAIDNFCVPGQREAERAISKEDCEKVRECVQANPKIQKQGNCKPVAAFYELSFS